MRDKEASWTKGRLYLILKRSLNSFPIVLRNYTQVKPEVRERLRRLRIRYLGITCLSKLKSLLVPGCAEDNLYTTVLVFDQKIYRLGIPRPLRARCVVPGGAFGPGFC
jgi:hypothetical protein